METKDELEVQFTGDPACQMSVEVVGTSLVLGTFDSAGAHFKVLRDGKEVLPGH